MKASHNYDYVSVVVPCYNESDGLFHFHNRLSSALRRCSVSAEIIYVNDGSVDDTFDAIESLQAANPDRLLHDFTDLGVTLRTILPGDRPSKNTSQSK